MSNDRDDASTSLVNRRTVKNRLYQRASRARRRLLSQQNLITSKDRWTIYIAGKACAGNEAAKDEMIRHAGGQSPTTRRSPSVHQTDDSPDTDDRLEICHIGPSGLYERLARLRDALYYSAGHRILHCDLLLSVTQYNIVIAMFSNSELIGLPSEMLALEINSPFNYAGPQKREFPLSLHPTLLQRQEPHHPWIDLLPMSSMRDIMLQHLNPDDLEELCGDLFGPCGRGIERVGLIIWGDAWDPSAYEISAPVIRKWGRMFRQCPDIIRSTNRWRTQRGEKPLSLPMTLW